MNDIDALDHSWMYVIQLNYVFCNGRGRSIHRSDIKIHLGGQDYITVILFGWHNILLWVQVKYKAEDHQFKLSNLKPHTTIN